jgi:hypothetical protein
MMNRVNSRSSSLSPSDPIVDQRLRKFSPIIKNSTMKDPAVRLSADKLLNILNSLDSDDSSDDEVHTYVEGFEKVEKSTTGLSSVLKGIHEKKPQLKSLEISKQVVFIEFSE